MSAQRLASVGGRRHGVWPWESLRGGGGWGVAPMTGGMGRSGGNPFAKKYLVQIKETKNFSEEIIKLKDIPVEPCRRLRYAT